MDWTKIPREGIFYINKHAWVVDNPVTKVGALYIEKETQLCKIGNGKRYNEIPYTPWSISMDVSTVIPVKDVVSSTDGLDVTERYIWDGDDTYTQGYILEYVNSIWIQSIPADGVLAWVVGLYRLKSWNGYEWIDVTVNTHNNQFGLEGGRDDHYYHLSEDDYREVCRMAWRYPVDDIIVTSFPKDPKDGDRIAISEATPPEEDTYDYRGYICEFRNGEWIFEDREDGQAVFNLKNSNAYIWHNFKWNAAVGGTGVVEGVNALTPVNRNCLVAWNDDYGRYVKDATKGAYVNNGLFIRTPYYEGYGEYKLRLYANLDTTAYAGMIDLTKHLECSHWDHTNLGFVVNMFSDVNRSQIGAGFLVYGHERRTVIAVKPSDSDSVVEAINISQFGRVSFPSGVDMALPEHHHDEYLKRSGGVMIGDIDMQYHRIANVPTPELPGDPVNLEYISGLVVGVIWQDPVESIEADPPVVPGRYLVASEGTSGVFVGHENNIAVLDDGTWTFVSVEENWGVFNKDDSFNYLWNGEHWIQAPSSTSHSSLQSLANDDHLQYVHIANSRSITAEHTFASENVPFNVVSNELVENLNAEFLGGNPASYYCPLEHTHEFDVMALAGFVIDNPRDGDTFVYLSSADKFINKPLYSLTVRDSHVFETDTERDNYFAMNPEEVEERMFCVVGNRIEYYDNIGGEEYDSTKWSDRSVIMRGRDGKDGIDGEQGPPGEQGAPGEQGQQGEMGPAGLPGVAINLLGAVETVASLPSSGNEPRDAYYCRDNGNCYVWLDNVWVNIGSITGPQGVPGPQGPRGLQGVQGIPGPQGPVGPTGPRGPMGERGPEGTGDPAWQPPVEMRGNAPPENYDHNDRFIVGDNPEGGSAWEGYANCIATFIESDPPGEEEWVFEEPTLGWTSYVIQEGEHYIYGLTGWTIHKSGGSTTADQVSVDTTNFDNNLGSSDDTVQKALETLDELIASGVGIYPSHEPPEDPEESPFWLNTENNLLYHWNTDIESWDIIGGSGGDSGVFSVLPVSTNCLAAFYDGNGRYIKNAGRDSFIPYDLFIKTPYGALNSEYRLKLYSNLATTAYAGIIDLTNYTGDNNYNRTNLGFVVNMINRVNPGEFGAGLLCVGRHGYLALGIQTGGTHFEPLQIWASDKIVRCIYGLKTASVDLEAGQTYNINGVPHTHNQYLSLSGGTMTGILKVLSPVAADDAVNLGYLSGFIHGIIYKDPVIDRVSSLPSPPDIGDRYIYSVDNTIATYSGLEWEFEVPETGWTVLNQTTGYFYNFNGDDWVQMTSVVSHSSLLNLTADDHIDYVSKTIPRNISCQHTFSYNGAPFIVNATTLVQNLNAEFVGGKRANEFALSIHSHTLPSLIDFNVVNPVDRQVLTYDEGLGKWVNADNAAALVIDPRHQFADATERDVYFAVYPEEVVYGMLIAVAAGFQQYDSEVVDPYDNEAWVDRTAVVRGPAGQNGINGADGATGPRGPAGVGIQGPEGPPGSPGASINMKGSVSSVSELPTEGNTENDGYYNEYDGDCYVWTGIEWANVGPIVGPRGLQGLVGSEGPVGPQGLEGPIGPPGPEGAEGPQGPQGVPGLGSEAWGDQVEGIHNEPPINFDIDDRFIVSLTPTVGSVFEGYANAIAIYEGNDNWSFKYPEIGWTVYDYYQRFPIFFTGTKWDPLRGVGTSVWGQITGVLSNQTDLSTALTGKADSVHSHLLNDLTDFSIINPTIGDIFYYNGSKIVNLHSDANGYLKINNGAAPSIGNPTEGLSGITYKGIINCSANPDYPAATIGDMYKVSAAGKIGGASGPTVAIGDTLICLVTTAAGTHDAVGANWNVLSGASTGVSGPGSAVNNNFPAFNGTSGGVLKDSGYGPTSFQPINASLTSIAGLAEITGILKKTAANTYTLDTTQYLSSVPIATKVSLGGIIPGDGLTINASGIVDVLAPPPASWTEMHIGEGGVYAVPTNAFTIHTYVSYVGKIYPGMSLKYNIGGTFHYAIVTTVTAVGIVIAGAPLNGSILELYHADANRNAHVDFFINGVFNSVAEDNMIRTYNKTRFRWQLSEARLVRISHCSDLIDSGANQPCINVKVNGVKVCTSNSNDGRALRDNIWTDSEVDINTSAYVVKYGDEIEVTTTVGGIGNAECLTVSGVLVLI